MKVQDLINVLLTFPRDVDVVLDIDDGMDKNYTDVIRARVDKNVFGYFVVLDADTGLK